MSVTQEFNEKMFKLLKAIQQDPRNHTDWANSLPDVEMFDVISSALNKRYLVGIKAKMNAFGEVTLSISNTRLTIEGQEFLLEFSK
ncbi:hypothetical protein [Fictibacillus sp. JL2B1089]|uniref:hypothetical protein n=1 Tax=Fictibacillus sp. JL2B1089 TaxID=3399565 RepID=UPI003A898E02